MGEGNYAIGSIPSGFERGKAKQQVVAPAGILGK